MARQTISSEIQSAHELLSELWQEVTQEVNGEVNPDIERLIRCGLVSVRYCLPTQLLGKLLKPERDCLCLQKGSGSSSSQWDPRSFATKVLVPWVLENQNVLGSSTDPYVSKPLRKSRLEEKPAGVKQQELWHLLYQVLYQVESANSEQFTRHYLIQTLRSIRKKLAELNFDYPVPAKVSIAQTEALVADFLSEASGGDRGLAVAAALFETFGICFGIYKKVNRSVINATDKSIDSTGDIECIGKDGKLRLTIEVKERDITLTDVRSAVSKSQSRSLHEFLFNSPGTDLQENSAITEEVLKAWMVGKNFYHLSIFELIKVGLVLTGEPGRKIFLENVGKQLDEHNTQPDNRTRWKDILENL